MNALSKTLRIGTVIAGTFMLSSCSNVLNLVGNSHPLHILEATVPSMVEKAKSYTQTRIANFIEEATAEKKEAKQERSTTNPSSREKGKALKIGDFSSFRLSASN